MSNFNFWDKRRELENNLPIESVPKNEATGQMSIHNRYFSGLCVWQKETPMDALKAKAISLNEWFMTHGQLSVSEIYVCYADKGYGWFGGHGQTLTSQFTENGFIHNWRDGR